MRLYIDRNMPYEIEDTSFGLQVLLGMIAHEFGHTPRS